MRYTLSELPSLKYVDLGEIIRGSEGVSLYQKESERYQHKEYIISLNAVRRNVGHCPLDRKSTRLNSSHSGESRMPSSA